MANNKLLTCIINAHDEGPKLLETAIKSVIQSLVSARIHPADAEILLVLDLPNKSTLNFAFESAFHIRKILVKFGDLAASRNFGVKGASGEFICFIDADDIWGHTWLSKAFEHLKELPLEKHKSTVLHPQFNLYFEGDFSRRKFIVREQGYLKENIDERFSLAYANKWSSASFGHRRIYQTVPFHENKTALGIGYEDWSFNLSSAESGFKHECVQGAFHFIRVRKNSMSAKAKRDFSIFHPDSLSLDSEIRVQDN